MPQRYKCKLFINIILLALVIQLRHLVGIYEMTRIDFSVPTIEHLNSTPIEKEIKIIYKQTAAREGDRFEHNYPQYAVTTCLVSGTFYQ